MANIGYATLSVIPSFAGFQSRLSAGMAAPMARAGATAGTTAGKQASGRFSSSFAQGIKGVAGPLAAIVAGAGVIDFLRGAVDEASALSESGNKLQQIFGPAMETITRFAQGAADSIGQSELQARNAAATFGIYGKSAGLAGENLAGFSTKLTRLASDFASFYDVDPTTAIEAIGSALRGENEPIRQFGILLDDATLRAEALKQGLVETTTEALTPQQKVLSAYQVILDQASVAQGDFARTSGSLANQQRILAGEWDNLQAEVGQKLLPAMTDLTVWANQEGLPMLKDLGGFAMTAGKAFGSLPGPVRAAAGAFVALRLASALGVNPGAWASSAGQAFSGLRTRVQMAGMAYQETRTTVMRFNDAAVRTSSGVGRMQASMAGLSAASMGAGAAMRRGLGSVVGALGGPWTLAITAGVGVLMHFMGQQREAAARVDSLRDSFNEQTGAITRNTRELAKKELLDSGALAAAQKLGLNLADVTDKFMGNEAATRRINDAYAAYRDQLAAADTETKGHGGTLGNVSVEVGKFDKAWHTVISTTGEGAESMRQARREQDLLARAGRDAADSTEDAAAAQRTFADVVSDARTEIDDQTGAIYDWIEAFNKSTLVTIQARRDQLALRETTAEAWKEVRKGTQTLNTNTKAGQTNMGMLLDLAEQWSSSESSVIEARGAYARMRKEFIDVATSMGASEKRANRLANELLALPKRVNIPFDIPGLENQQEKLERMRRELQALMKNWRLRVTLDRRGDLTGPGITRFQSGGKVGGSGTGDRRLILADPREWVINPKASAHYGDSFLAALNKMQVPRMQSGGNVGSATARSGGGVNFNGPISVVAHDYRDFMGQMQHRTRRANSGGVNFT